VASQRLAAVRAILEITKLGIKKINIKTGIHGEKTISTLAFCADRAFGVCTNKHDDYRPKDKYSTNFWRANSSPTGSVPHHV
jgi:hypothetical protein